jgi:hypothetical protein
MTDPNRLSNINDSDAPDRMSAGDLLLLLLAYRDGELSSDEQKTVDDALARSPRVQAHWESMKDLDLEMEAAAQDGADLRDQISGEALPESFCVAVARSQGAVFVELARGEPTAGGHTRAEWLDHESDCVYCRRMRRVVRSRSDARAAGLREGEPLVRELLNSVDYDEPLEERARQILRMSPSRPEPPNPEPPITKTPGPGRWRRFLPLAKSVAVVVIMVGFGFLQYSWRTTPNGPSSEDSESRINPETPRDFMGVDSLAMKSPVGEFGLSAGEKFHFRAAHPQALKYQWLIYISRTVTLAACSDDPAVPLDFQSEVERASRRFDYFVLVTADEEGQGLPANCASATGQPLELLSEDEYADLVSPLADAPDWKAIEKALEKALKDKVFPSTLFRAQIDPVRYKP